MPWEPSDAWRDSYDAWKLAGPPEYEGDPRDEKDDGTELCPACNVEWADQYRGHCDVCGSTGRVRKLPDDGPTEEMVA